MADRIKSSQRVNRPSPRRAAKTPAPSARPTRSTNPAQTLQQTIGNQAVQRLARAGRLSPRGTVMPTPTRLPARTVIDVSAPPVLLVQRAVDAGLAAKGLTNEFGKAAYDFWKDPKNKDKPLQDLSDHLIAEVNQKLPYPCATAYLTSGTTGAFNRTTWTLKMNTTAFSGRPGVTKVGDLNQAEVAEVVDTIFHEARHSDQFFRIARVHAGEGLSAKKITTGMGIPKAVADEAVKDPLKGGALSPKANKMIAEAKAWEQITVGKYAQYKSEIAGLRDEIQALRGVFGTGDDAAQINGLDPKVTAVKAHLDGFFAQERAKIGAIKKRDKFDSNTLRHIGRIIASFDMFKRAYDEQKADPSKYDLKRLKDLSYDLYRARYDAYRDYEHEKDTWALGAKAAASFNKYADKQAKKKK